MPCVASSFRSRRQESTKFSPYEIVFGSLMRLPVELRENVDPYLDEDGTTQVEDFSIEKLREMEAICTDDEQHRAVEHLLDIQKTLFGEVASNIESAQDKQVKNYNKCHKGVAVPVGTKVWRHIMRNYGRKGGKMEPQWDGPFIVTNITDKDNHELTRCSDQKVYAHKVPSVQLSFSASRREICWEKP